MSTSSFVKYRHILLAILVIVTHIYSYAQNNNPVIIGKDYVYALFTIEKQNTYPIIFAAILDSKDTLYINTHSVDSCILQVYTNAKSAPVLVHEYYKTFYDVFGENSRVHQLCERFSSEYEDLFSTHCLSKTFKLDTGETMRIQYARFVGLIAATSYTHSLSIGLSTTEYPSLKERFVPLSILESMNAEDFVITESWITGD